MSKCIIINYYAFRYYNLAILSNWYIRIHSRLFFIHEAYRSLIHEACKIERNLLINLDPQSLVFFIIVVSTNLREYLPRVYLEKCLRSNIVKRDTHLLQAFRYAMCPVFRVCTIVYIRRKCVRVCVRVRVNYFSKFALSPVGCGTHTSHISIGIHAGKKFNERYSDTTAIRVNS